MELHHLPASQPGKHGIVLGRVLSGVEDFAIWPYPKDENVKPAEILSPEFLKTPKYRLSVTADASGTLTCKYEFRPIGARKPTRKSTTKLAWATIRDAIRDEVRSRIVKDISTPRCGPFSLEIRAWDINTPDLEEIDEHFHVRRSMIRSAIRAHKGISVYRDGILVLPKTEGARDWLGLDLRRVSKYGPRLSTSQIIGYVLITATDNPGIRDTSPTSVPPTHLSDVFGRRLANGSDEFPGIGVSRGPFPAWVVTKSAWVTLDDPCRGAAYSSHVHPQGYTQV